MDRREDNLWLRDERRRWERVEREIKVNTVSAGFFDATCSNYIHADIFHQRKLSLLVATACAIKKKPGGNKDLINIYRLLG